jgi:hypothetical protein
MPCCCCFRSSKLRLHLRCTADNSENAHAFYNKLSLQALPVGYDLSVEDMERLGVYISDREFSTETGETKPFAEPSIFVVNTDGTIQIVDISNSPGIRPDINILLSAVQFSRDNEYPIRGRHGIPTETEEPNLEAQHEVPAQGRWSFLSKLTGRRRATASA